ncbi:MULTISPECIES: DUF6124 family protein [unclassified Pseudomonas]|uniref:DUF6124 family protein n=1 Tax=unclassified Pseudomonas TaxID=196821 RepID=UPI002AC8AE25|nr:MULTISPECIES: DUF6124 family protein [unclassified Pseudomonas]MEB0044148.1 DUF6124 family protein [Pseudomonas sp. Dout3]MEB0094915.1 DUF6124 family protein [Pseudomonas sp. DC1.2]WPX59726.1 DUF6124 family protein [Pseudomonas sp. DC1.2]
MKKPYPKPLENPILSASGDVDPTPRPKTSQCAVGARRRAAKLSNPMNQIFTVIPDIDTPTLLAHASESLASLNVMTTGLADQLEGSHRNVALAIKQLAVLAEMLINRALENLESPDSVVKPICH